MKYYLHQGGKGKMFFHQKPFRWPKTSRQVTIIPKPELRGFGGDSLTKPPFGVTSAEVVIICPENMAKQMFNLSLVLILFFLFLLKRLSLPWMSQGTWACNLKEIPSSQKSDT